MEGITPVHLIAVVVIALLIFGPGRLPETGAALGKAIRDFRHSMADEVSPASPTSPTASPRDQISPTPPRAAG